MDLIAIYFEGKDAYKTAEEYNNNLKKQLGLSFDWQYKHAFFGCFIQFRSLNKIAITVEQEL